MAMISIFAIFFAVLHGTVFSSTCQTFQLNKDYFDVALIGHSLLEVNDTNHHECARTCMSVTLCKSIDFNKNGKICKLNDIESSASSPTEFESRKGSIFSDINNWPDDIVGSCISRPCQTNQNCYPEANSHLCRDITCAIGLKIDRGIIQVNAWSENMVLDLASVKCDTGYVPSQLEVMCQASGQWQPATCKRLRDCKEILDEFPEANSGLYEIEVWNSGTILTVNCDMETDGGGWTVFHRRMDGSVDFYRNLTEYENGFGNVDGELWLGLKYVQEIAEQGPSEVRLDMVNENNNAGYETCQDFQLTDGIQYTLHIGTCNSFAVVASRGIQYHGFAKFSTFDRDLDTTGARNCAVARHGGFWYKYCGYVNLNGLYVTPGTLCNLAGAEYGGCGHNHDGFDGSKGLRSSTMMLRRT